jgi:hypothetical protein
LQKEKINGPDSFLEVGKWTDRRSGFIFIVGKLELIDGQISFGAWKIEKIDGRDSSIELGKFDGSMVKIILNEDR